MRIKVAFLLTPFLLIISVPAFSAVITFDSLSDSDLVTNQFSGQGVMFQNAIALTAGISLNEFEFPPKSNSNVISDNGGPISITFSTPQLSLFAFFTYAQAVTVQAFDALSAPLGSASSAAACSSNLALSGVPGCLPNEQISLGGLGPISRVTITGALSGGSFTLDDLNFSAGAAPVPEPLTCALVSAGLGLLILRRRGGRPWAGGNSRG